MKAIICQEEWYPVLEIELDPEMMQDGHWTCYEIPEDLYARYEITKKAFEAVQEELEQLMETQKKT